MAWKCSKYRFWVCSNYFFWNPYLEHPRCDDFQIFFPNDVLSICPSLYMYLKYFVLAVCSCSSLNASLIVCQNDLFIASRLAVAPSFNESGIHGKSLKFQAHRQTRGATGGSNLLQSGHSRQNLFRSPPGQGYAVLMGPWECRDGNGLAAIHKGRLWMCMILPGLA